MIRLFSANTQEYQPLADITGKTKAEFAAKFGYEFVVRVDENSQHPWDRAVWWRHHLEQCEWLFFMGADVNGFKKGEIAVNVNGISSLSALATAIATAIRAYATNDGFTVPANSILIPTYQLG